MLRVKKPQPPLLSKILRDKQETRQRRIDQISALDELRVWAGDEDGWDRDVKMLARAKQSDVSNRGEVLGVEREGGEEAKYVDVVDELLDVIKDKMEREEDKQRALAVKFWEIVKQERRLVGEEKEARREEKVRVWVERMREMVKGKGGVWIDDRDGRKVR